MLDPSLSCVGWHDMITGIVWATSPSPGHREICYSGTTGLGQFCEFYVTTAKMLCWNPYGCYAAVP
jgi:hypothetical protein